ncbi:MAG TPA: hybrid sensor histidine kinase/response regulator [Spirochaetia bacterium]|nr:hybrid sensor histidine kinase/response regulator [Spirochaetia bacterium]
MAAGDGRRSILVVDDSPDDIAILNEELRVEFRVLAATDIDAAFRIARHVPHPDLVLLDVMMPGMDGYEFCRALKADPATRSIPVIFVTVKGAAESEAEGFESGGVDYITKPVNPLLVKARARTHIELKAAREELERQNGILRENMKLREEVDAINRHDMKNPLMIVTNLPGLLLADPALSDQQREFLRMIEDAGHRMLEMVNRTVDLVKMENGAYACKSDSVDALKLVNQVRSGLGPLVSEKRLDVRMLIRGKEPAAGSSFEVLGEQALVYSILANLIQNAAEASPEGETISVRLDEAGPGSAEIVIHNRGAVPASIRGRFLEKYATAGKARGTGIGAYSARLMARTMGGDLRFETSEEAGTTIFVRLRSC